MKADRPLFFAKPAAFRAWLEKHHQTTPEQWIGFYRKASGHPSITWPEAVDEALCFGWIDGLRKTIDASSYKIRFTPRSASSIWSAINIARMKELIRDERVRPAGMTAFSETHTREIRHLQLRKSKISEIEQHRNEKIPRRRRCLEILSTTAQILSTECDLVGG